MLNKQTPPPLQYDQQLIKFREQGHTKGHWRENANIVAIEEESDIREGKGRRSWLRDGIVSIPYRTRDFPPGWFEEMDE